MIRLQIDLFRCYQHKTLNIPLNKITLLSGDSGQGKTTVLQAIYWCLFGKCRLVHPKNLDPLKAKTRVQIIMPYTLRGIPGELSITRYRNPNRLELLHNQARYEDDVAQALVNEIFGTQNVWLCSSYLAQNNINTFLTLSEASKMEILNHIAFHLDDPERYIEKIDLYLSEKKNAYEAALNHYTAQTQSLTQMLQTLTYQDHTLDLTTSEGLLNQEYQQLQQELPTLVTRQHHRDAQLSMLTNLQQSLERAVADHRAILNQVIDVPPDLDLQIDQLELRSKALTKRYQLQQQIADLRTKIKGDDLETFTLEQYQQVCQDEYKWQQESQKAVRCGLKAFDQANIDAALHHYQTLLDAQPYLKTAKQQADLANELTTKSEELARLPVVTGSLIELAPIKSSIDQWTSEHSRLTHIFRMQKDILYCPKCHQSLKYHDKNLVTATEEVDQQQLTTQLQAAEQALKTARQEYDQATAHNQQLQQARAVDNQKRQTLAEEIDKIQQYKTTVDERLASMSRPNNIPLLSEGDTTNVQNLVSVIRSIQYIDKPKHTSTQIQAALQAQTDKLKIQELNFEMESIEIGDLQEVNNKIRELKNSKVRYNEYQKLLQDRATTERNLREQYDKMVGSLPEDNTQKIKDYTTRVAELHELLTRWGKIKAYRQLHNQVTDERNQLLVQHQQLTIANTIRQCAVECERDVLTKVIAAINTNVNSICKSIFEDHIRIILSLFKTTKTTKVIKPTAHLAINYRDCDFDNGVGLSGGESDRVSIALTMALNRLTGSPLMILDESLKGIHSELKMTIINTIRSFSDCTVLIVGHSDIEGIYDNIIEF